MLYSLIKGYWVLWGAYCACIGILADAALIHHRVCSLAIGVALTWRMGRCFGCPGVPQESCCILLALGANLDLCCFVIGPGAYRVRPIIG